MSINTNNTNSDIAAIAIADIAAALNERPSIIDEISAALSNELPDLLKGRFVFEAEKAPSNISRKEIQHLGEAVRMLASPDTTVEKVSDTAYAVSYHAAFEGDNVEDGKLTVLVQVSQAKQWNVLKVLRDPRTGGVVFAPHGIEQRRKAFGFKVFKHTIGTIVVPNGLSVMELYGEALLISSPSAYLQQYKETPQYVFPDGLPLAASEAIESARRYASAYNAIGYINKFVGCVMLTQPEFSEVKFYTSLTEAQVVQTTKWGDNAQGKLNVRLEQQARSAIARAERSATPPTVPQKGGNSRAATFRNRMRR